MAVSKKVAKKHRNRSHRISRLKKFGLCGTYTKKTRAQMRSLMNIERKSGEEER